MEKEQYHLIKIVQQSCENETWFQEHKLILNLQSNTNEEEYRKLPNIYS